MRRRMTIVFDDEEPYTQLKVEAARSHRPAKDLVAEALLSYFDVRAAEQHLAPQSDRRTDAVDDALRQLRLAKEPSGSTAR